MMESRETIASFLLVGAGNLSEISVRIGDCQPGASKKRSVSVPSLNRCNAIGRVGGILDNFVVMDLLMQPPKTGTQSLLGRIT